MLHVKAFYEQVRTLIFIRSSNKFIYLFHHLIWFIYLSLQLGRFEIIWSKASVCTILISALSILEMHFGIFGWLIFEINGVSDLISRLNFWELEKTPP